MYYGKHSMLFMLARQELFTLVASLKCHCDFFFDQLLIKMTSTEKIMGTLFPTLPITFLWREESNCFFFYTNACRE